MIPLRSRTLLLAGSLASVLSGAWGCAAPPAVLAPRPVAAPAPVASDPLAAPLVVTATSGSVSQQVRLETSLVSRVDSTERRDIVRAFATVAWSRLAGDSPARISGLLTAFGVSADSVAPYSPAGLLLPLPFAGVDGGAGAQVRFTRPEVGGCGSDAAAVQLLRELFVSPPRRLEAGTTWADSAQFAVCRDSITLDVRSVRTFRVTSAERRGGETVAIVERTSRVSMQGEGRQFGESLTIAAEGEGTAQLAIRLTGGFVVAGEGDATLRMTMRGRRRSQELTQRTRISITAP